MSMTTTDFQHHVSATMAAQCRVAAGSRIVVAVSGGADSVALLEALTACGYECVAAHCNFHLRGAESDRDMAHVRDIAARLGVELHVQHFDVPAQMRATGQSVEMACRDLRYKWFARLMRKTGAAAVAVGHHREDQAETFMLNLLRGTGIAGLTGMAPRNGDIVRPMLDLSRRDITEYLAARGLTYVDDSSNTSDVHKRNRLRNTVLPEVERQCPGGIDGMLATMRHLTDNRAFYDYAVQALAAPYTTGTDIDLTAMTQALPAPVARMLLFELLKVKGFNITHIDNILQARRGTAKFSSDIYTAVVSRGKLHIDRACTPVSSVVSISLAGYADRHPGLTVTEHPVAEFRPERDPWTIYMDAGVLQPDSDGTEPVFELRPYRCGDRMRPYGMRGTKLLSNIFADARLTAAQKAGVRLLTRNGVILWAIGLRASAYFPITADTRTYLQITATRPDPR